MVYDTHSKRVPVVSIEQTKREDEGIIAGVVVKSVGEINSGQGIFTGRIAWKGNYLLKQKFLSL